ncbi:hypothetical protein [Nitratireductor pacificus]|uniref:Uncharacterized protein n=1 Tax=Nitratireductor pacificus pht-3B TaxID=391937 RepID=K2M4S1_9HYPH|nr:hypothetical protein [Nitratireductor pacificus]EKF17081.1 hypothetical protein NA2_19963 [Nitratireductor pacificus pht-3B]
MNAQAAPTDGERLRAIRAGLSSLDSRNWQLAHDDTGPLIEAVDEHGAFVVLARLSEATFDEGRFIATAPETIRFLLSLVDRAIASLAARAEGAPAGRGKGPDARSGAGTAAAQPEPKDFAAEAAMKCTEPAFKTFLAERHGLEKPATDARTAQRLRSVLGVTSRRDLNDNGKAAARWKALRAEFQAWRTAG